MWISLCLEKVSNLGHMSRDLNQIIIRTTKMRRSKRFSMHKTQAMIKMSTLLKWALSTTMSLSAPQAVLSSACKLWRTG